jgi:hypothetical protein
MALVASVLVLALFLGVFYRQDLGTVAAQTRGMLTLAAGSFSSHLGARKAELVAPRATPDQGPKEKRSERSDRGTVVTKGVPATTTSVVGTLQGASLTQKQKPQADVRITPNVNTKDLTQFTNGTTAVVVQLHDDLRQICLLHLGRYNAEVLREIRKLNPELSNPDRITVGQRIVLPASATLRSNASRSPSIPRQ